MRDIDWQTVWFVFAAGITGLGIGALWFVSKLRDPSESMDFSYYEKEFQTRNYTAVPAVSQSEMHALAREGEQLINEDEHDAADDWKS